MIITLLKQVQIFNHLSVFAIKTDASKRVRCHIQYPNSYFTLLPD